VPPAPPSPPPPTPGRPTDPDATRAGGSGAGRPPPARGPGASSGAGASATAWGPRGQPVRRFGRYVLLEPLGRGANGVVYRARVEGLLRDFALKVLLEGAADPEGRTRFRREAQLASRVDHPGIVPVVDAGTEAGHDYYVMELVRGPTLQARMSAGPLAPAEAAALVADLARAVGAAHAHGIVHRDLKPANVILDAERGLPRVTDFGLARARDLRRSLTRTGDVLGTPIYMAPEQFDDAKGVDARADVYALGAILYRCLVGRAPVEADTVYDLARRVAVEPPPPPRSLRLGVPPALEAVCLRALAKAPGERYASGAELADALEAATAAPPEPPPASARRRRRALAAAAAGVAAVAAVGAALGLRTPASPADAAADPPAAPREPTPTPPDARPPAAPSPSPDPPAPAPSPDPSRLAPDAALAELDRLALEPFRLVQELSDPDAVPRLRAGAGALTAEHPEDPRARGYAALAGLFGGGDGLLVYRELRATARAEPAPPPGLLALTARLAMELGFQRAAADLAGRAEDTAPDHPWVALTRIQVLMKADPPVRDWAGAAAVAEAAVATLRAQGRARGDGGHPPAWDLLANLAALRLAMGDRAAAAEAYAAAGRLAERAGPFLARQADAARSGRLPDGPRALESINATFAVGELLGRLAGPELRRRRRRQAPDPAAAARELEAFAGRTRRAEAAALALVRAGRLRRRAGDPAAAAAALARARALDLGDRDADVRLLVARSAARAELARDRPDAAEPPARDAAAPPAGPNDPRTAGERADARLLLGWALLAQGRRDAAGDALADARAEGPRDRRELEALTRALGAK